MSAPVSVLALALVLAGCGVPGSVDQISAWHPAGANDANLAAMVADPLDLVTGAASRMADGTMAADAVGRYHAGKIKKLPDVSTSKVSAGGSSGGSDAAAVP